MTPVRVVPGLNPGKDRQACLGVRLPSPPINEFALQAGKETLGHGVVVGVADTAHGRANAHFFASVAKRHTGVLLGFKESLQRQLVEHKIVGH